MNKDRIVVTTGQTNDMLEEVNGKIIGNPKLFSKRAVEKSQLDVPNAEKGLTRSSTEPENKAKI